MTCSLAYGLLECRSAEAMVVKSFTGGYVHVFCSCFGADDSGIDRITGQQVLIADELYGCLLRLQSVCHLRVVVCQCGFQLLVVFSSAFAHQCNVAAKKRHIIE